MTGRTDNGILINNSSSQQAKLFVDAYRRDFNYPAWFENTLGYAESGQISVLELQRSADDLLNRGIMTVKRGVGEMNPTDRKRETEKIIENMYGDDINLLHGNVSGLGDAMDRAKLHRDSNAAKIEANKLEHGEFWDSIKILHDKHTDQETRITRNAENIGKKADIGHKHSDNGGCAWYDIQCHLSEGFEGLGKLALIGGVAIVGIWLLKMRLGK